MTFQGSEESDCRAQVASRVRAVRGGVGVDGGDGSSVAGVEGLDEIVGLGAADLADDEAVGAVAQGMLHQVTNGDGAALLLRAGLLGFEPQAVGSGDPELAGVLDADDALLLVDE